MYFIGVYVMYMSYVHVLDVYVHVFHRGICTCIEVYVHVLEIHVYVHLFLFYLRYLHPL